MSIKKKIEAVGIPLKDWDIQINYGIKTGLNEAFIISEEKRNEILSKCATAEEKERTEQIIRPVLRGRDIERYGYNWKGLYLCWIPWHFPLHFDSSIQGASDKAEKAFKTGYPALYNHMLSFKESLEKRNTAETGIRYEWYALQRWGANYWEDLNKPKILYSEIVQEAQFFFDKDNKFLPEATVFSLTGENLDYLYVCLNSSFYAWVFKTFYAGGGLGEHGYRYKKIFLQKLPVSKDVSHIRKIRDVVTLKGRDKVINDIFYNIYAFSSDEVFYIRGQINK